ncbi:hypothetical protein [Micromonospora sp. DT227]|uniref:hypothetical protein n=1 Tax=Micromonospora sp. DT227 TaxID=3393433 RepID=UPI003CFB8A67
MLGECQVGRAWAALDGQDRPVTVATLDGAAADDQRWREAFTNAADVLAQTPDGHRYVNADFDAGQPWVVYPSDGEVATERLFRPLGMDWQRTAAALPPVSAPPQPVSAPPQLPWTPQPWAMAPPQPVSGAPAPAYRSRPACRCRPSRPRPPPRIRWWPPAVPGSPRSRVRRVTGPASGSAAWSWPRCWPAAPGCSPVGGIWWGREDSVAAPYVETPCGAGLGGNWDALRDLPMVVRATAVAARSSARLSSAALHVLPAVPPRRPEPDRWPLRAADGAPAQGDGRVSSPAVKDRQAS